MGEGKCTVVSEGWVYEYSVAQLVRCACVGSVVRCVWGGSSSEV